MNKVSLILVLCLTSALFGELSDNPPPNQQTTFLGTAQPTSKLIRTQTAAATMLDDDTKSWAYCKANFVPIPVSWSMINLSIYAYDSNSVPDGNTGTIYIYGCEYRGGAKLIGYGNFTIGSVQLSHNPVSGNALNSGAASSSYEWADTYTALDSGGLLTNVRSRGGSGTDPNGNIMNIEFDRKNLIGIYVDVNNITFGTSNPDSITIIMNGY